MHYFDNSRQVVVFTNEENVRLPAVKYEDVADILHNRDDLNKVVHVDDEGNITYSGRQPLPTPDAPYVPEESKDITMRKLRDAILKHHVVNLDRHRNQVDFGITPTFTQEEAHKTALYVEMLRNLPDTTGWPDVVITEYKDFHA